MIVHIFCAVWHFKPPKPCHLTITLSYSSSAARHLWCFNGTSKLARASVLIRPQRFTLPSPAPHTLTRAIQTNNLHQYGRGSFIYCPCSRWFWGRGVALGPRGAWCTGVLLYYLFLLGRKHCWDVWYNMCPFLIWMNPIRWILGLPPVNVYNAWHWQNTRQANHQKYFCQMARTTYHTTATVVWRPTTLKGPTLQLARVDVYSDVDDSLYSVVLNFHYNNIWDNAERLTIYLLWLTGWRRIL